MPCVLTQGYALDCRDSVGGMDEAWAIEFDNVTTITKTANVVTALTKASGKRFWKYRFPKQTASFKEGPQASETNGTIFYKQDLSIVLNKMQTATRNEIMLLAQNRLLWVIKDLNGKYWLLGETGAMLVNGGEYGTGTQRGDRNGYMITFEGNEPAMAVEVNSTVAATLETAGA